MVRCGMMSFAEKAAQQSQEHRIQTQLLGEIKDLKNYIDDAVASVERNIRLTAKVPVEIIQKKINRGIEIIIELGDRPSAGLYRMFFNISYPKWLNRIRAVQEGICQETMYYTSYIQCQQRCEASLYVPLEDQMEIVMLMHWTVPLGVFVQNQTIGYYQMEPV